MSELSQYCKIFQHKNRNILYSTKNSATVVLSDSTLRDVLRGGESPDIHSALEGMGFIVSSRAEEKTVVRNYINACDASNNEISFLVALNLSCNLACPYCFEGTAKGPYFMSRETEKDLVSFIEGSIVDKTREIFVTFYGGEPLLSVDAIVRISERLNDIAANKNLKYTFGLTTNGTLLTSRVVQRLKPLGLAGAKVTIDGPRDSHNISRPYKSGAGSFDTIILNLKQVCPETKIRIGGNFARDSFVEFPKLLDYLSAEGLITDSFTTINFGPVLNSDAECSEWCSKNNETWALEAGILLRQAIIDHGYKTRQIKPYLCRVNSSPAFVVNYNGDLYKCPSFIGKEDFKIGTLKAGPKKYSDIYALESWKNDECLSCCYLPLCWGGCRYLRLVRTGDVAGVDCRKDYYDSMLESFILQDIEFNIEHPQEKSQRHHYRDGAE